MDEIQETHLICLLTVPCALQDFLLIHQGGCQVCSSWGKKAPNHNAHMQEGKTWNACLVFYWIACVIRDCEPFVLKWGFPNERLLRSFGFGYVGRLHPLAECRILCQHCHCSWGLACSDSAPSLAVKVVLVWPRCELMLNLLTWCSSLAGHWVHAPWNKYFCNSVTTLA